MVTDSDRSAMRSTLREVGWWACVVIVLFAVGCGPVKKALDWTLGTDKPTSEAIDADGDGIPDDAPAGKIVKAAEDALPYGTGALMLWLIQKGVAWRRRQQAKEAA